MHEEDGALDRLPGEDDVDWFLEDMADEQQQEEEEEEEDEEEGPGALARGGGARGEHMPKWNRREVDYMLFEREIWPKIKAARGSDTKNLSASALFTEITSYIKGSSVAMDTKKGFLSREEYLRLPWKMAPSFDGIHSNESVDDVRGDRKGTRDLIYDLFEVSSSSLSDHCFLLGCLLAPHARGSQDGADSSGLACRCTRSSRGRQATTTSPTCATTSSRSCARLLTQACRCTACTSTRPR